jgi:hypothetical protein
MKMPKAAFGLTDHAALQADYPTVGLREYWMTTPGVASLSTLTQSGLIGQLLERERRKALRIARRRAFYRKVAIAIEQAIVWSWRTFTGTVSRKQHRSFAPRRVQHA